MIKKDHPNTYDPESREEKIRQMERDLYLYDPRRLQITREDLDELGIEYDGELYEPKP